MQFVVRNRTRGIIWLLFFISALASGQGFSQGTSEKKWTISPARVRISEVFRQLEIKAGVNFIYTPADPEMARLVRITENSTLKSILTQIEQQSRLVFSVSGADIGVRNRARWDTRLEGSIRFSDQEAAIGATVRLVGEQTISSMADSEGNFKFTGFPAGTYNVRVSSVGYSPIDREVGVFNDLPVRIELELEADKQHLKELTVWGKNEVTGLKEGGYAVNAIEMKQLANSSRDLNQVLNTTTGVRIREQGGLGSDFDFSINGLSGKAVRFFIDGIPMENFGNSMSLNNIPVNLAERVEVYKGVVPIELGADALGGAVNVVTNKGVRNYLDASYSVGSFNTHRAALNTQFKHPKNGLIARVSGFYNYADNNYRMHSNPEYDAPIRVPDGTGGLMEKSVRRFHDQFRSAMIQGEAGVADKSWADILTVGLLYTNQFKEYQTGATQNVVYGEVHRHGDYLMPSVRYKKENFLVDRLTATAFASYGRDQYAVIDTSRNTYWWDGSLASTNNNSGEFGANTGRTITEFRNAFALAQLNLSYRINDVHSLNLNGNFGQSQRRSKESFRTMVEHTPSRLTKNVLGFAWQSSIWDKRLVNSLFAKYYQFDVGVGSGQVFEGGQYVVKNLDRVYRAPGYGLASRFKVNEQIGVKASFEYAYRLPDQVEVLGDGIYVTPNLQLKPESSHNLNVGGYFRKRFDGHHFALEASGFLRQARDFIYSIAAGNYTSQFMNEGKVRLYGFEGETKYEYHDILGVTLNLSYQKATQNQSFIYGTGNRYATYGNDIPNRPWLYGNADIGIGKSDWIGEGTRLQFNWATQYVHWFYLNWEAWGSKQSKNKIPTQLLHHVSLSYSFAEGKYNISLESRNLMDRLAYDNFRQQKPGRAMYVKLRWFLK